MCGKFTAMFSWRKVHYYSDLVGARENAGPDESVLNTPMRTAPVVCLDAEGKRTIVPMRWGWIDLKAANPLKKPGMMHARGETLDVKPLWKQAFASTRGVVWADTFNVGEEVAPGKVKQWNCRRADGKAVAIAVVWERWDHPEHGSLHVFVPVTTASPPAVHAKDERFPALLVSEEEVALWLGETDAPLAEVKTVIRTYTGELIVQEEKKTPPPKKPTAKAQPDLF
jgi:putative SOS response-associated peptidase YedK